jgi:hypothetical protein
MMQLAPIVQLLYLWTFLACAFALWAGGTAERLGAGVVFFAAAAPPAAHAIASAGLSGAVDMAADGIVGLAFLLLTVRYGRVWLGVTMLLFGAQFALHSFYAVTQRPPDLLHARINNTVFVGVSLCLWVGAALAWRRRRRVAGRKS